MPVAGRAMTVQCSKCGEELMGSVNRCWRCGQEFVSRGGPAGVPPIRRSPVKGPPDGTVAAEVIEPDHGAESRHPLPEGRWSRRGSPFGAPRTDQRAEPEELVATAVEAGPRLPSYPRNLGATGGAVAAIALGIISFFLAFTFPVGALIIASFGLGLGIWGLYSKRRGAAILGLLICCISFATGGFYGTVNLYTYVHGISPFETFVPVEVEE